MKIYNNFKYYIIILSIILFKMTAVNSALNNKIIAKVGNDIITSYELENKIRTMLFLSKTEINQININKIKKKALNELINLKLKKDEIKKFKTNISNERIDDYVSKISNNQKTTNLDLKEAMAENSISFELFYEDIKINLSWQNLIYELNKKKINIDENKIVKELNEIILKKKDLKEYELAEITIDLAENFQKIEEIIKEVKNYINETSFEEAALRYSESSSAMNGGNIGWINSSALSNNLKGILGKMKVGEISDAINNVDKVIFIKILNKRSVKINVKDEAEKIKTSLINQRTNELLNLYSNNHLSKKRNNTVINLFNE